MNRSTRRLHSWRDHSQVYQERLTRQQEIDLSARAKAGDRTARDAMILSCYPMVFEVCRTLKCNHNDRDDMAQAAVFGLMRAVDGYDASLGLRLSTYCWRGILFAATTWRFKNYNKTRRLQSESCEYLDEIAVAETEPDCERREEQDRVKGMIRIAISDLSKRECDVIDRHACGPTPRSFTRWDEGSS